MKKPFTPRLYVVAGWKATREAARRIDDVAKIEK